MSTHISVFVDMSDNRENTHRTETSQRLAYKNRQEENSRAHGGVSQSDLEVLWEIEERRIEHETTVNLLYKWSGKS